MLFGEDGPDIPLSLLRAQRGRQFAFHCGRRDIESSRPSSVRRELADLVYGRLGASHPRIARQSCKPGRNRGALGGAVRRLIGLLEQRLVLRAGRLAPAPNVVREAVAALVQPEPRARIAAHLDLLRFARGRTAGAYRHNQFRHAVRARLASADANTTSAAVQAPAARRRSYDFTGVPPARTGGRDSRYRLIETDLVLTSANFGEAFMRNGWASHASSMTSCADTRSCSSAIRRNDPPMRYMLEATEEGRLTFRPQASLRARRRYRERRRHVAGGVAGAAKGCNRWFIRRPSTITMPSTGRFQPGQH